GEGLPGSKGHRASEVARSMHVERILWSRSADADVGAGAIILGGAVVHPENATQHQGVVLRHVCEGTDSGRVGEVGVTGVRPGTVAQRCVIGTRGVVVERLVAVGGILPTRGVGVECVLAVGGVVAARGVRVERGAAAGGIAVARGARVECVDAAGGVVAARGVGDERAEATSGIAAARRVGAECPSTGGSVIAPRGVRVERYGTGGSV